LAKTIENGKIKPTNHTKFVFFLIRKKEKRARNKKKAKSVPPDKARGSFGDGNKPPVNLGLKIMIYNLPNKGDDNKEISKLIIYTLIACL